MLPEESSSMLLFLGLELLPSQAKQELFVGAFSFVLDLTSSDDEAAAIEPEFPPWTPGAVKNELEEQELLAQVLA